MTQPEAIPSPPVLAPRVLLTTPDVLASGGRGVPAVGATNSPAPPQLVESPVAGGPHAEGAKENFLKAAQNRSSGSQVDRQLKAAREALWRAIVTGESVQIKNAQAQMALVYEPIVKAKVAGFVTRAALDVVPIFGVGIAALQLNESYQAARVGNLTEAGKHAGEVVAAVGTAIASARPAIQNFLLGAQNVGNNLAASGLPPAMVAGRVLVVTAAVAVTTVGLRELGGAAGAAVQQSRELPPDPSYVLEVPKAVAQQHDWSSEMKKRIAGVILSIPGTLEQKAEKLKNDPHTRKAVNEPDRNHALTVLDAMLVSQQKSLPSPQVAAPAPTPTPTPPPAIAQAAPVVAAASPPSASSKPIDPPALTGRVLHVAQHGDVMTRIADSNTPPMKMLREKVRIALGGVKPNPRNEVNLLAIILADANAAEIKNIDIMQPGTRLMEPRLESIAPYVEALRGCGMIDAQGNISPAFKPRNTPIAQNCSPSLPR